MTRRRRWIVGGFIVLYCAVAARLGLTGAMWIYLPRPTWDTVRGAGRLDDGTLLVDVSDESGDTWRVRARIGVPPGFHAPEAIEVHLTEESALPAEALALDVLHDNGSGRPGLPASGVALLQPFPTPGFWSDPDPPEFLWEEGAGSRAEPLMFRLPVRCFSLRTAACVVVTPLTVTVDAVTLPLYAAWRALLGSESLPLFPWFRT